MLSIGEFSQAARLTVKTLRFYHELGLLIPVKVDQISGYRYYDDNSFEQAKAIITLKEFGFSLTEIKEILQNCSEEEDLHQHIRSKLQEIRSKVDSLKQIESRLEKYDQELELNPPGKMDAVEEITINLPHLAALPVQGSYKEIGTAFNQIYKKAGKYTKGQPYGFYYDMEYKEEAPVFEAAAELRQEVHIEDIKYKSMTGLRAVKTVYRGQYGGQGSAYMRLFRYCKENSYEAIPPIIEHYIKGPGMIFRRNPKNYITECILLLK